MCAFFETEDSPNHTLSSDTFPLCPKKCGHSEQTDKNTKFVIFTTLHLGHVLSFKLIKTAIEIDHVAHRMLSIFFVFHAVQFCTRQNL